MEPSGCVGIWWQFTAHSHIQAGLSLHHLCPRVGEFTHRGSLLALVVGAGQGLSPNRGVEESNLWLLLIESLEKMWVP